MKLSRSPGKRREMAKPWGLLGEDGEAMRRDSVQGCSSGSGRGELMEKGTSGELPKEVR